MASTSTSTTEKLTYSQMGDQTIKLLERVLQKCEAANNVNYRSENKDYFETAMRLTGLNRKTVMMLTYSKDCLPSAFFECPPFDRSVVHKKLMDFYLNLVKMPSTKQLFNSLEDKLPPFMDIRMFRKLLVKWGYAWRMIQNLGFVVFEKPAVTFERYRYLKSIKEYREKNMPIVFIDEVLINNKKEMFYESQRKNYITVEGEVMCCMVYGVFDNGICDPIIEIGIGYNESLLENWIEKMLLVSLPTPHVIVLPSTKSANKEIIPVPNQNSLKIEMIEWLEYHDVPCNEALTRSELFTLVEKYTNTTDKLYKIDTIFQCTDHIVLRLPKHISQLTPATFVREKIQNNLNKTTTKYMICSEFGERLKDIFAGLSVVPEKTYHDFHDFIAKEEKAMYELDLELDGSLDSLVEIAKMSVRSDDPDSDVPSLSESE